MAGELIQIPLFAHLKLKRRELREWKIDVLVVRLNQLTLGWPERPGRFAIKFPNDHVDFRRDLQNLVAGDCKHAVVFQYSLCLGEKPTEIEPMQRLRHQNQVD